MSCKVASQNMPFTIFIKRTEKKTRLAVPTTEERKIYSNFSIYRNFEGQGSKNYSKNEIFTKIIN